MFNLVNRRLLVPLIHFNRSLCASYSHVSSDEQSTDLYDSFNRRHNYLRISLTEKCNLRCTYCMPAEGVQLTSKDNLLTRDEIVKLAKIFVTKLGVTKIRLTGGEPMVSKDLMWIVEQLGDLKNVGLQTLALTTNGIKLSRNISSLVQLGLDAVNISLDTLNAQKFTQITRRNAFHLVNDGIDAALKAKLTHPVKINCVIMKDVNVDEVIDFVSLTKDKPLDIRFIEYMPFDGNSWSFDKMIPGSQLISLIQCQLGLPLILRDKQTDLTAKSYQVPGHLGTVGFISSMTDAFCHSCNRLRITADGCLKVCLFDKNEVSLKHHLRHASNDQQVQQVIQNALKTKKAKHAGVQTTFTIDFTSSSVISRNTDTFFSLMKKNRLNRLLTRHSSHFTHLDHSGQVNMVNVTNKKPIIRRASAVATVELGSSLVSRIESETILTKGNVIAAAKLAGIQGAKVTSSLIPLCHLIPLNVVHIDIILTDGTAEITCSVEAVYNTGVEMEALTGASVAALTIYDMCKAINKNIIISSIKLMKKEKIPLNSS